MPHSSFWNLFVSIDAFLWRRWRLSGKILCPAVTGVRCSRLSSGSPCSPHDRDSVLSWRPRGCAADIDRLVICCLSWPDIVSVASFLDSFSSGIFRAGVVQFVPTPSWPVLVDALSVMWGLLCDWFVHDSCAGCSTAKVIEGCDFDRVKRWTKNVDIFDRDLLLIPICKVFFFIGS